MAEIPARFRRCAAQCVDRAVAVVLVLAVKIQRHDHVEQKLPEGLNRQIAQRSESALAVLDYCVAHRRQQVQRVALNLRIREGC